MSEPESEAEPYSEPIPEPEAMSEPTPLSDPEPEAEMEPVTGGYSEATPQAMEFALPPAIVILVIIFGALVAYCISHRRELTARIKRFFKKAEDEPELEIDSSTIHTKLGPPETTSATVNELESIALHTANGALPLLRIILPAVITIIFCPLLLVEAEVFKDLFWNGSGEDKLNVNDALGVFLVPISLLFALMFSVSFEHVLGKQIEVRSLINREVNILYKLKAVLHNLSWGNDAQSSRIRLQISKTILLQALDLVWQLKSSSEVPPWQRSPSSLEQRRSLSATLSGVVDIIRAASRKSTHSLGNEWQEIHDRRFQATNDEYDRRLWILFTELRSSRHLAQGNDMVDGIFLSKLAENVMDFGDIAAQRRAVVGQTLSLFQWVFMEALGFITFIAILLVDASSPKCELAMCMTTAFCVALLTLVVADGDDPYHGFIRVKAPSLPTLVRDAAQDVAWMNNFTEQCQAREKAPMKKDPLDCLLRKGSSARKLHADTGATSEKTTEDCTIKAEVLPQSSMINFIDS